MGFGLCNAAATYSRVMNLVLRGLNWKIALAFLDDILVLGKCFEDHLANLRQAFSRFRKYGLRLKPKKCVLFQTEIDSLGRRVTGNSPAMTDSDIVVVRDWPVPARAKDLEHFMGLANYHRGFVPGFSELADPLYKILGKGAFRWEHDQQSAFDKLKPCWFHLPCCTYPIMKTSLCWIRTHRRLQSERSCCSSRKVTKK